MLRDLRGYSNFKRRFIMKKGIVGFVTICSLILLFKMVCGFSLVAQYDVINLSEVCVNLCLLQ